VRRLRTAGADVVTRPVLTKAGASEPELDGLLVRGVEDESPAARAGIQRGDLIVAVAGEQVDGVDVLHQALDAAAGNGGLMLTVVRGTEERQVDVELSAAA